MNKQELRKVFRQRLKANAKNNFITLNLLRKLNSARLLYFFKKLYNVNCDLQKCKTIALYYPLYYEINCLPIALWLKRLKITTLLPRVNKWSKNLSFHVFNCELRLQKNAMGIKEPLLSDSIITPQALVIPMLAFDNNGNRLGRGGGFYDYTLAELQKTQNTIAIGAAYSWQEASFVPTLHHDVRLNAIITNKFYKLFN